MRRPIWLRRPKNTIAWWVLSCPLFVKIMGIGLVVAGVFGGATLIQTRGSVSLLLHQMLEERTRTIASALVASLERPMSTNDILSITQKIRRARQMFPDVRYIIVRDPRGRIISHTFRNHLPPGLARDTHDLRGGGPMFQVLAYEQGLLFDVIYPILDGHAGTLQVGLSDANVLRALSAVTRNVVLTLLVCLVIGAALAVALTNILTRPIQHLVETANHIRDGRYASRSRVFSGDEVGRLAVAFNQMAQAIQAYEAEVTEKERVRVGLIEKIVTVQEMERKNISRELHDQLGQSLLALLLKVQASCGEDIPLASACGTIAAQIRQLIDDVGQLAWGMRPSILDDYGLDSALARHVEEISEHSGLQIDYQYIRSPDLDRLPSRVEEALFRIAQESLTNILRHAHAERASVVVLQQPDGVTLLVEDDGCGFVVDAAAQHCNDCFGLTSMQERAALLNGTCTLESLPGQGTTLRVKIPMCEG